MVSYGGISGGLRASQTLGNVDMMAIPQVVPIPFSGNFIEDGMFTPNDKMKSGAAAMLDELLKWSEALKPMRANA